MDLPYCFRPLFWFPTEFSSFDFCLRVSVERGGCLLKDYRGVTVNTSDIKWTQLHYDRNNRECHYHTLPVWHSNHSIHKKRHILAGWGADRGGEAASVEMNDTRPRLILHINTPTWVKSLSHTVIPESTRKMCPVICLGIVWIWFIHTASDFPESVRAFTHNL